MKASVILSTYNQPRALELSLWGYSAQVYRGFDIVIADDGSGSETAAVIERMVAATQLVIHHVWHPDRGFRKTEILNRAIVATDSDYLIFSDGDCIPRDDFVAVHVRLAREHHFLSGGYIKLPAYLSDRITRDDVLHGRVADLAWLKAQGWRPGRRALRLLRSSPAAAVLDRLTPTRPSWNGHNASTWRKAIVAANGFDLDMAYGGEDRALGERLENAGVKGIQIRHRAATFHLEHPRPYATADAQRSNSAIRARIRRHGETRARLGIAELGPPA